eukprot:6172766-Pleurochrysis_carterae.AAC.2
MRPAFEQRCKTLFCDISSTGVSDERVDRPERKLRALLVCAGSTRAHGSEAPGRRERAGDDHPVAGPYGVRRQCVVALIAWARRTCSCFASQGATHAGSFCSLSALVIGRWARQLHHACALSAQTRLQSTLSCVHPVHAGCPRQLCARRKFLFPSPLHTHKHARALQSLGTFTVACFAVALGCRSAATRAAPARGAAPMARRCTFEPVRVAAKFPPGMCARILSLSKFKRSGRCNLLFGARLLVCTLLCMA